MAIKGLANAIAIDHAAFFGERGGFTYWGSHETRWTLLVETGSATSVFYLKNRNKYREALAIAREGLASGELTDILGFDALND